MTSKQINFFILPQDWKEIDLLFKELSIKFIPQPLFSTTELFADSMEKLNKKEWEKGFLTRFEFQNKVEIEYIDQQRYYLINDLVSPVIEFSRGGFYPNKPNELHRARLYFIYKYYNENDEIVEKDKEFIKWANGVFKLLKKNILVKLNGVPDYYSKKVIEWIEENNAVLEPSGLKLIRPEQI